VAGQPASAAIYQLDGIVRRAPSLQLTADARASQVQVQVPVQEREGVPA
jgi:NADH-quinone oxidoreductase subunit G